MAEAGVGMKELYSILNTLMGSNKLPDGYNDTTLAKKFMNFFDEKITRAVT